MPRFDRTSSHRSQRGTSVMTGEMTADQLVEGVPQYSMTDFGLCQYVKYNSVVYRSILDRTTENDQTGGIIESSLAGKGRIKFANGLMIQWGEDTGAQVSDGRYKVTFPVPFEIALFVVHVNHSTDPSGHGEICGWKKSESTIAYFTYLAYAANTGAYSNGNGPVGWIAIGH